MSLRWMLVLAAELGFVTVGAFFISTQFVGTQRAHAADSASSSAKVASAASTADATARSPKQLRDAVAEAMRRANSAKGIDRAAAVKSLLDVYRDLGRDALLPAKEKLRLGVQVRTRLQRLASQFHYETVHNNSRGSNSLGTATGTAAGSQSGAAGGPAVEGLDSLVDVIQTTIGRPDDWVAAQQGIGQQGGNGAGLAGGVGAGIGGGAAAGRGGAFGNNDALEKGADANGADLVDLIQKTVDPPSWEANGGIGTIMYFNNLRVLVVRQTGEGQENVGGLLGGMRKN